MNNGRVFASIFCSLDLVEFGVVLPQNEEATPIPSSTPGTVYQLYWKGLLMAAH